MSELSNDSELVYDESKKIVIKDIFNTYKLIELTARNLTTVYHNLREKVYLLNKFEEACLEWADSKEVDWEDFVEEVRKLGIVIPDKRFFNVKLDVQIEADLGLSDLYAINLKDYIQETIDVVSHDYDIVDITISDVEEL